MVQKTHQEPVHPIPERLQNMAREIIPQAVKNAQARQPSFCFQSPNKETWFMARRKIDGMWDLDRMHPEVMYLLKKALQDAGWIAKQTN